MTGAKRRSGGAEERSTMSQVVDSGQAEEMGEAEDGKGERGEEVKSDSEVVENKEVQEAGGL